MALTVYDLEHHNLAEQKGKQIRLLMCLFSRAVVLPRGFGLIPSKKSVDNECYLSIPDTENDSVVDTMTVTGAVFHPRIQKLLRYVLPQSKSVRHFGKQIRHFGNQSSGDA